MSTTNQDTAMTTKLTFQEGELPVDNTGLSYMQIFINANGDFMTVWLGKSPLKLWLRTYLFFLLTGVMCHVAFLPHPFAITNLAAMMIILVLNGRELLRVRGINKNMGWPHLVAWVPVLIVNVICLTTDWIDNEQVTWENAGDDTYLKARYIALWYNTIMITISCLFDALDTYLYYSAGKTQIERSAWTVQKLTHLPK